MTAPSHSCAHCRLPLGASATDDRYCCSGCRTAHALIDSFGLARYYDLANDVAPGDSEPVERPWLDTLLDAALATHPRTRVVLTLDVQGMHCAACVWVMQALFEKRPGHIHLAINPGIGRLTLTFDADRFPLAPWLDDLAKLGYRTGPPCREAIALSDGLGVRLGVTIAIAMNVMALSFPTYFGLERDDADGLFPLFSWAAFALTTISVLVAGPVFIRGAFTAARRGALHLDVPIAIGLVLAYIGSVALFFSGRPELAYFDTLAVFLALMMLGRWAQRRLLDVNRRRILDDDGFTHVRIKALDGDRIHLRPVAELTRGTRFLVAPGELVPVAATIDRPSELDLAWLTGESHPVPFAAAAIVPAGAHLSGPSARIFTAAEDFSASDLHTLIRSPDAATPRSRLWRHLTTAWVIVVLGFAAIVAVAWWASPLDALQHATAVLVVTCPCAIGIATPLAHELANLRLRKRGLLARHAGLLLDARAIRHVVFDKTGTLTLTQLSLDAPSRATIDALSEADRDALYQLTARSNHPKSRAIQAILSEHALDTDDDIQEIPGRGLCSPTHTLLSDDRDLVFATPSTTLARLSFAETLRHDAKAEINDLVALGIDVHIATGDAPNRAQMVAVELGIAPSHVHASMLPADKAALVDRLGADETLFLGDGINDALAFEHAAIAGTPALDRPTLPARADFVVTSGQLGPIADLIRLGQRVHAITLRNLAIAATYNVLALVAGLAGWLSPVVAAIAMPTSSLLVIALTTYWSRTPSAPGPIGVAQWMPST